MDSNLPHEINIEILSRTSLKTLDTIVSTNKEFRKLTYDPYFLHLYKQRNNIVSGFIVQCIGRLIKFQEFAPSNESTHLDLGFLSRDARILATSEQGIMVFESPHRRCRGLVSYNVCKPATKQVVILPNPKTHYSTKKVAIVVVGSNPFHYKILRLSRRGPNKSFSRRQGNIYTTYCCEIFDSVTFAWKLLDDIMLLDRAFVITTSQPITIGGSIYMLLSNNNILKFDIYSEKRTIFPLPIPTLGHPFDNLKLVKYEGGLALGRMPPNGGWEIWVGTMNEPWEKKHVFNEKEDTKTMSLESFYDSDTSVLIDYDTLVFYKFKKGDGMSKIRLSGVLISCYMFVFRSDFEPVDLRGR